MLIVNRALTVVLLAVTAYPLDLNAGGLAKTIARDSAKSLSRGIGRKAVRGGLFELLRDRQSPTTFLAKDRLVDRYTLRSRASREVRSGIAPYRHMTSTPTNRPLSAATAQRRLGLAGKPEVVERIRIPKGTAVHINKVVKGKPGYGEITSLKRLPNGAIKKVIPLK
jgi:hypothetical protein